MNTESVQFRTLGEDHRQLRPARAAKPLCSPPPPHTHTHTPPPLTPTPPHPSHTLLLTVAFMPDPWMLQRTQQIQIQMCLDLQSVQPTYCYGRFRISQGGGQKSVAPPGRSKFRKYHTYEGAGVGDCLRCELVAFSQCRHYECSTFYNSCHGTVLTTQLAFHALHTQCCLGLLARSLPMLVAFD